MEIGNKTGNKKYQSQVQYLLYKLMSSMFCHCSCILGIGIRLVL